MLQLSLIVEARILCGFPYLLNNLDGMVDLDITNIALPVYINLLYKGFKVSLYRLGSNYNWFLSWSILF